MSLFSPLFELIVNYRPFEIMSEKTHNKWNGFLGEYVIDLGPSDNRE